MIGKKIRFLQTDCPLNVVKSEVHFLSLLYFFQLFKYYLIANQINKSIKQHFLKNQNVWKMKTVNTRSLMAKGTNMAESARYLRHVRIFNHFGALSI